jgi:plasmid stabilization system protein ParE
MNRLLVLEPEAEAEIFTTADWYRRRNPAAGAAFLDAVNRALRLIQEHPEQYQVVYREARRALVDGFPYAFFYKVTDREIIIISCFHTSRNPKVWRDRLR